MEVNDQQKGKRNSSKFEWSTKNGFHWDGGLRQEGLLMGTLCKTSSLKQSKKCLILKHESKPKFKIQTLFFRVSGLENTNVQKIPLSHRTLEALDPFNDVLTK